jgi:hypothetical protein
MSPFVFFMPNRAERLRLPRWSSPFQRTAAQSHKVAVQQQQIEHKRHARKVGIMKNCKALRKSTSLNSEPAQMY